METLREPGVENRETSKNEKPNIVFVKIGGVAMALDPREVPGDVLAAYTSIDEKNNKKPLNIEDCGLCYDFDSGECPGIEQLKKVSKGCLKQPVPDEYAYDSFKNRIRAEEVLKLAL